MEQIMEQIGDSVVVAVLGVSFIGLFKIVLYAVMLF